jgi:hypothetical protein
MNRYHVEFITPLFSRGAYEDRPEIRPASIRGQLHGWFRALGGNYQDEQAIFGSVHGHAAASRVVVRVTDLPEPSSPPSFPATLPHKPAGRDARNGPNAPRCAFPAGSTFTLVIAERLGGLSESRQTLFERSLQSWLLAGSLGLRATRGGGSFRWADAPREVGAYREQLRQLLGAAPLRFDLLDQVFSSAEEARKVITETISHAAMGDVYYPLGAVRQGRDDPAPSRKTSPLRLTVRGFADGFRILALWDDRQKVTGNTLSHLRTAVDRLANGTPLSRPTKIGKLLQQSALM